MKKLRIGMPILGLDGEQQQRIDQTDGMQGRTLRHVIIDTIGSPQFRSTENAIILRKVATAIYTCKDEEIELEDNELTVLKNALSPYPIDPFGKATFEDACKEAEK